MARIRHDDMRAALLAQHETLRALMGGVADAAHRAVQGDATAGPELRSMLRTLGAASKGHLVTEEALLGPILERIDAWGPQRKARMEQEHKEQHRELDALADRVAHGEGGRELALDALTLVDALDRHMDAEERDLLDPRVLRDDCACLDQSDA